MSNKKIYFSIKVCLSNYEWNLNDFLKYLLIRWEGIIFHSWKFSSQTFWSQEDCKVKVFEDMSTCFSPPFTKLINFSKRFFFFCCVKFFYEWVCNDFRKYNFLEISVLEIIIFPCNDSTLLFQKWRTCWILFTVSRKLFCSFRVLLYENWIPKVLIVSAVNGF